MIHSTRSVGQTFTVGKAGILTGLELSLSSSGTGLSPLIVEILVVSGGISGAPVVASVSVAQNQLGSPQATLAVDSITATFVDLKPEKLSVGVGDLLAFRLSTAAVISDFYGMQIVLSDLYADGGFFVNDGAAITFDVAFKTFVACESGGAVVPVPHKCEVFIRCSLSIGSTSI